MRDGQRPPCRSPPEPRAGPPCEGAERGCGALGAEARDGLPPERSYLVAEGARAPSREPWYWVGGEYRAPSRDGGYWSPAPR